MTTEAPPRRPRGRPRDPRADARILDATRQVVGELGVAGASMSAIADRAGVGKPTIYLRWPNRRAVIAAATDGVMSDADEDLRLAVLAARTALAVLAQHPHGRFLAEVMFDLHRREEPS